MSDTLAAILILPALTFLVLALECSRLGCTHLVRRLRSSGAADQEPSPVPQAHL